MRLTIVLHNIRSCYNVGAILRTAEGLGVERVILSGYTPRVHDPRLLPHLSAKLDREIHKTALGAEDMVSVDSCDDVLAELGRLKAEGWRVVGLENNITEAVPVYNLSDDRLKVALGERVVMVLGEEVAGIDKALYGLIDVFVEIPMRGHKESLNVSVAAGIAIYGIMEL